MNEKVDIAYTNPFLADEPAHEYFVGRERELRELRRYLRDARGGKPTNLYIVGGGGDGKTSFLLKAVEEATSQGLLAVYMTIDSTMTLKQVIIQLLEGVLEALKDRYNKPEYLDDFRAGKQGNAATFRIPQNMITTKYLRQDLQTILRACESLKIRAIVFCLDEGQNLKTVNGQLLAHLRGAIQEIGRGYMIILASLEDIMPEVSSRYSGVDRFFPNRLSLGPFDADKEARSCIRRRLQDKSIRFSEQAIDLIVRISGRHPRDIVSISHHAFNNAIDGGVDEVTAEMADSVIYDRFGNKVDTIRTKLGIILPPERDTLKKLVSVGGRATTGEIARLLCGDNEECIRRMTKALLPDLVHLCSQGICVRESSAQGDVYRVSDAMSVYILAKELAIQ